MCDVARGDAAPHGGTRVGEKPGRRVRIAARIPERSCLSSVDIGYYVDGVAALIHGFALVQACASAQPKHRGANLCPVPWPRHVET